MKLSTVPYKGTRFKLFQPERVVIQQPLRFGIRGEENLKTAVQSKAFHQVCAHSPTWVVIGLEQGHRRLPPTGGIERNSARLAPHR